MAKRNILKNTVFSILPRLGNLVLGFLSRKLIVEIIAVEYLGLSSLYTNLLDFLNLAELGIGIAIQVRLYKPLVNGENDKVSNVIYLARRVYANIGKAVFIIGFISVAFLNFIIKDNPFEFWYVALAYILSVIGIGLGYFCASKRLYFESNEKYYFLSISDMVAKFLMYAIGFVVLYLTKEYLFYAGIVALQAFVSNLFLSLVFKKKYGKIYNAEPNLEFQNEEFKAVKKNLKEVVPMKLSGYVFSSTSSIVISAFLSLTMVAIYANYFLIFNNLLSMSTIASTALFSTFGKMEQELNDKNALLKKYKSYEDLQFMFSSFTAVCVLLLVDKFMILWMGPDLLLSKICVVLLSVDYFIHSSFQPMSTMYVSTSKFKQNKVCSILACVINLGLSIILINFIGVLGVVIGVITSNVFTYVVRTIVINKQYFNRNTLEIIFKPILQLIIYFIEVVVCWFVLSLFTINNLLLDFLVSALICMIIPNILNVFIAVKKGYHKKLLKRN